VLGDAKQGYFVPPEVAAAVNARLVPEADLVTPNAFELEVLTGIAPDTLDDALEAAHALLARGPRTVLVTSLRRRDGAVGMVAVTAEGAWLTETPVLPLAAHGIGDLTAALFTAHLLEAASAATALERTTGSVHAVLEATVALGRAELALVAAQEQIATPPVRFAAVRVG
jgi:pyridoxine kinase